MSTQHVVTPNGTVPPSTAVAEVVEIQVTYDEATDCVTVCPLEVPKGSTVRFKDSKGGKLKIAFLSAMGKETETLWDTDVCTLSLGGIFHFNCYFSYPGKSEIKPQTGGTIGVVPPRP